jgi:glyoxylate reductase
MPTTPPSVLVTRPLPSPGTAPLRDAGLQVEQLPADEPTPPDRLREAVTGRSAVLCLLTERIDAAVLDAAGPGLRIVANMAVGYDNIDVVAAAERGVVVTNTPDVLTEATADLTWALLLAAARRVVEGDALVRAGRWDGWSPTQLLGAPVAGRTLGIVGLGKIGAAVARRARGFGMTVLYHNRGDAPGAAAVGARRVDLDELLSTADVVSLHAPLNEASRHLIDAAALARMKPTAVLVNTARGPLVDEAALVDALRDGAIAAAGLDVYEAEPRLVDGLAGLPNVVLAPHVGSATTEARAAMVRLCCENILAVLDGRPPLTPVG